jgi:diketogulonate reductase-like aldo/keto reductase
MPVMAYSPLDEGRLLRNRALAAFAQEHGYTPAQVALAWLLAQEQTIVIPKSASVQRVEENARTLQVRLSREQLRELDELFIPPTGPAPLAMI